MTQPPSVQVTINGCSTEVPSGITILAAAQKLGVEIPTLCHHADLSPVGSCRLCLVEIAGREGHHPACAERVASGMEVTTESPQITESRRFVLEMLLARYHDATPHSSDTQFQRWLRYYDVRPVGNRPHSSRFLVDSDPNPFLRVDLNKCILCTNCVRACEEVQGRFVWTVSSRGPTARLTAGVDTTLLEAGCEACGACAAYCPTGALSDRMYADSGEPEAERSVRTTCGYCGVGCQFDLQVSEGRVVRVTSDPTAPVNGMSLCVKGRYGYDYLHHKDRLTKPLVRRYLLDNVDPQRRPADRGEWVSVSWRKAIDLVARRLRTTLSVSGPQSLGFLSSAKCTNEENFLLQKLARQLFQTNNVDHCARLCHSSTVVGLNRALGSGAMSNSMDDVVNHAAAIFIIGSNVTEQHPVFGAMLRQAVLRRQIPLVVADPRRIDITDFATLHVQQRPGTDVALINGIMYLALQQEWYNRDFIDRQCEGFEELRASLEEYPPSVVSRITGVPEQQLREAARLLCTHHPMAVVWAMGITQHTTGVFNVLALANLQLMLGNIGVAGGGVNPLRGQNNVQGACDMGALPDWLPGYQPAGDSAVQAKFNHAWMLEAARSAVPWPGQTGSPGKTVTELIDAAGAGEVRALYVLGEDPAMTEPDSNHTRHCLERAAFVVLQEIFPSETSPWADVLLPGAAFAEKSGTFTNTERRIQPVRRGIAPPGDARADWEILTDVGQTVLRQESLRPRGPQAAWDYSSPADVLSEIAKLTPAYGGVSWARVDAGERLQWPIPTKEHPGTPILHEHGIARGKGRFHAVHHVEASELPDDEYPLLLTTGRVLYHWHGGEMSRRAQGLAAVYPQPILELSPVDARTADVDDGQEVWVQSRRGDVRAHVCVTDRVPTGVVFATFHFPGEGNVNNLTISALDPVAKIPEYKVCAVKLRALSPR